MYKGNFVMVHRLHLLTD